MHISATVVSPASLETMNAMVSINIAGKLPQGHLLSGCSQLFSLLYTLQFELDLPRLFFHPSAPTSGLGKPLLEEGELESGKEERNGSEPKPVSYPYTFCLIFALASLYSAMILTGGLALHRTALS